MRKSLLSRVFSGFASTKLPGWASWVKAAASPPHSKYDDRLCVSPESHRLRTSARMRVMKTRFLLCTFLIVITFVAVPNRAQTSSTEGAEQFAELGDFKLRDGSIIQDFRLGYRTLGKLNTERSNAILWPTWLGGKSEDLLKFLGPGKVVDTANYFVILVDAIGNGISTSPSSSKKQALMRFPMFGIRDMVEAEHRLVTEVLHLPHLRAVMGISMGGMQTFEWVVTYSDFMDVAIPMAGSPQSTSFDKLLWTSQIDAIELDPAWNKGNPTGPLTRGFAISEEIGQMNLTSPAYRVTHTSPKDFDAYLAQLKKSAAGERLYSAAASHYCAGYSGRTWRFARGGCEKSPRAAAGHRFPARSSCESYTGAGVCRGRRSSGDHAGLAVRAHQPGLHLRWTNRLPVPC